MQDSCQEPGNEWVTKLRPKSLKNFASSESVQLALWQHVSHFREIRHSGLPTFCLLTYRTSWAFLSYCLPQKNMTSLCLRLCSFCLTLPKVASHRFALVSFSCNLMVFCSHKLDQIGLFQVLFKNPAQQQMAADSSPHSRWIVPIVPSGHKCRCKSAQPSHIQLQHNFIIITIQHYTAPASSSANQRLDPVCTASSLASAQMDLMGLLNGAD